MQVGCKQASANFSTSSFDSKSCSKILIVVMLLRRATRLWGHSKEPSGERGETPLVREGAAKALMRGTINTRVSARPSCTAISLRALLYLHKVVCRGKDSWHATFVWEQRVHNEGDCEYWGVVSIRRCRHARHCVMRVGHL